MSAALQEARKALIKDEVPVGAVVVFEGKIIAHAHNSPISRHDPTAHAEILALRKAAKSIKNYRLINAEIYVTIEPCIMCMGSIIHARIKRLVFGACDKKTGAAGSVFNLSSDKRLNHPVEVVSGIMEEECRSIIQEFFLKKRVPQ